MVNWGERAFAQFLKGALAEYLPPEHTWPSYGEIKRHVRGQHFEGPQRYPDAPEHDRDWVSGQTYKTKYGRATQYRSKKRRESVGRKYKWQPPLQPQGYQNIAYTAPSRMTRRSGVRRNSRRGKWGWGKKKKYGRWSRGRWSNYRGHKSHSSWNHMRDYHGKPRGKYPVGRFQRHRYNAT